MQHHPAPLHTIKHQAKRVLFISLILPVAFHFSLIYPLATNQERLLRSVPCPRPRTSVCTLEYRPVCSPHCPEPCCVPVQSMYTEMSVHGGYHLCVLACVFWVYTGVCVQVCAQSSWSVTRVCACMCLHASFVSLHVREAPGNVVFRQCPNP